MRATVEATYVVLIASLACWGFLGDSTLLILAAVALALPLGLPALVGYYMAYGVLALTPGANPSTSSGTDCSPGLDCAGTNVSDTAAWFEHVTDGVGIAALTFAAVANLALVLFLRGHRAPRP